MKSSTKGMELAAGTIVLLIVGILILTAATGLTYRVVCSAEKLTGEVDSQTEARIEQLMRGSGKVAVADNTKTSKKSGNVICGGSRASTATFSLGIRNTAVTAQDFEIRVVRSDGTAAGVVPASGEVQYFADSYAPDIVSVPAASTHTMQILVVVPGDLASTQQVYNVNVIDQNGNQYGVQQLFVVPS